MPQPTWMTHRFHKLFCTCTTSNLSWWPQWVHNTIHVTGQQFPQSTDVRNILYSPWDIPPLPMSGRTKSSHLMILCWVSQLQHSQHLIVIHHIAYIENRLLITTVFNVKMSNEGTGFPLATLPWNLRWGPSLISMAQVVQRQIFN